ncbi:MAG TPA: ABC transporter ATP-binding protein [Bacteroidota bacterium]|nr:ABC transporter ATP-binding protein [Bacteroidota bacterium]
MSPAIELVNLRYRYPDGKEALRGVSFTVAEGECIGIVGPNGSGKSTLLLHLNGILPDTLDTTTSIAIHGRPVNRDNVAAIRREVGLLFQDPDDQLFCPTVYEDVAFGPTQFGLADSTIRANVARSLSQVGLEGFESRSPHHLSIGEKRRVCLAGILACDPKVLALDEPTTSLDPRAKRGLHKILKKLPVTKVIATHDLEMVVELCSRTILLDDGAIVADGPTAKLLGNETLMLKHGLEKPHILRHHHPH